ncbi:hypothetical protein BCR33DRAFT_786804 [Rhizoclosmatium globosum]|uniref:BZIP domain-containing protein n=1 Tax=Rhizoclosmatium globosum TaxID=329046 RepID=A0A1Y2C3E5_9FUNG|nr:hypothetical protein BCR33DRAFT_786804 [Rhizoclosmatium globosum]|eukprot:ORY41562.1 hypothetical protein BCR33DRAFT_786804 [Rhizoclosmatium globosum]
MIEPKDSSTPPSPSSSETETDTDLDTSASTGTNSNGESAEASATNNNHNNNKNTTSDTDQSNKVRRRLQNREHSRECKQRKDARIAFLKVKVAELEAAARGAAAEETRSGQRD